ncbi:MAG: type II toxin-antitoxin system HicA family toxin [Thermodesulfobacteriota bacterium]
MRPLSGRELARIVETKGWRLRRVSGSHHIYGREGTRVRLSIPIHGNKNLKAGTQRTLMRLAGLTESDLFDY